MMVKRKDPQPDKVMRWCPICKAVTIQSAIYYPTEVIYTCSKCSHKE